MIAINTAQQGRMWMKTLYSELRKPTEYIADPKSEAIRRLKSYGIEVAGNECI